MNAFRLPEDIDILDQDKSDDIIFHCYTAPAGTSRGKSVLSKNAISMVITGEKTMHFADKRVVVKDDEFHFLSSGNCLVTMELAPQTMFKSILIFFDNSVLANFKLKYEQKIRAVSRKPSDIEEPYLAFKKDAFVLNYITSLDLLLSQKIAISREMKLLKFEELMLHLLEKYPAKILSFPSAKSKDIDDLRIRTLIETNIQNKISLDELAFLCNLSLSTFKRRFLKIYGVPPSKWIMRRRMELAKELLQYHHEKPGEVFHKVGYENHSSFTHSFKQTFGMTPKDFQKQQLNVRS